MFKKSFINSKSLLIGFGLISTTAAVLFYLHAKSTELQIAKLDQMARADLVRKKLDLFATTSNLLSHFIQEDISRKKLTQIEIENKLKQFLSSSPNDLIFGIGIWYEPFQFKKETELFGPYIHRPGLDSNEKNGILTYEWNTKKYHYPSQTWYKLGLEHKGESTFVDPYFDSGLVYVTNSRLFYNEKNRPAGVISVDVVMPQLQSMILQPELKNDEHISIISRTGNLLAHPLKDEFFKAKKIVDGKNNESLLNYKIEDIQNVLNLDQTEWINTELDSNSLGWKIHISSSKKYLLKKSYQLHNAIIVTLVTLWSFLIIMLFVLEKRKQEKLATEHELEVGRVKLIQSSKMATLGEMASGISHEINNPLTIIIGKTRTAKNLLNKIPNEANADVIRSLDNINSAAERISRIIKGLKSFSRSGDEDPFIEEPLNKIIQDTIALCEEWFINNQVRFDVSEIPNVKISCRATQVSQVFLNLLSNSFDAIKNNPEKWIKVDFLQIENKIQIYFIDSGLGIPNEVADRIMQPFFTTKAVGSGTGLGLSISKGIIEAHHGKLELDKNFKNTKFVITLPIV